MTTKNLIAGLTLAAILAIGLRLGAQAPTDVPPPVPGAKPVAVERIKIHGASLEGQPGGQRRRP